MQWLRLRLQMAQLTTQDILKRAEDWLNVDTNFATRQEIESLVKDQDYDKLRDLLGENIKFGTAGLRASMAAGFSRMNEVTVMTASQGLAKYVLDKVSNALERGIVIGYDHRHNSSSFARVTADSFTKLGYRVHFLGVVHTPMVPFGVNQLKAACGVMITASHNPKDDNGYKVYWSNGCQIIPPHDEGIERSIRENSKRWPLLPKDHLISYPVDELHSSYFACLMKLKQKSPFDITSDLKFLYTPMHGVGTFAMQHVVELLGVTMIPVKAQAEPDPDFPTVSFPNPEEKGALDIAIQSAKQDGISYVLANDPDADRFTAAALDGDQNYKQLTGNQLGILFAYYILSHQNEWFHTGSKAILNSTVSSQALAALANHFDIHYEDTLTGFKWLGNRAMTLESEENYSVPFAYEEAIGYMFSDIVHDKDGIAAAFVFTMMMAEYRAKKKTPFDVLEEIAQKIGYYADHNSYYVAKSPDSIHKAFAKIRSGGVPSTIGRFTVTYWRDLTEGYDSSTKDHQPVLPVSKDSEMITVDLADRSDDSIKVRFTARGSGTEPKLKVYIEARSNDLDHSQKVADEVWELLSEVWFADVKG